MQVCACAPQTCYAQKTCARMGINMMIAFKSCGYEDSWTGSVIQLIASMCNILYGQESIILKPRLRKKEVDYPLPKKEQKNRIDQFKKGIEVISDRIREGTCTKELFIEYNNFLHEQRVDSILKETEVYSRDFIYEQEKAFHQMISLAEQCYENVYLDCGMERSPFSKEFLKRADLTFINLYPEKSKVRDVFLEFDLRNQNVCILMENEDVRKDKSSKHLLYTYPILNATNTIFIPFNKEIKTANVDSLTSKLIYKYIECESDDEKFLFIEAIKNTAYKINEISENVLLGFEGTNLATANLKKTFVVS